MMNLCLLILVCASGLLQDDPVFSGPQPGEKLMPFTMIGTIGKDADRKIDVVAEAGDGPLVIVFVHERSRPAFGLANAVMRLVSERGPEKIVGGLVYLADDPTEAADWMNRVKQHLPQRVRKGVSADGSEGPGAYGLNRNVAVTLLVVKNRTVTANFALIQPSLAADAPQIFKAIADVLGEKEVPDVAKYVPGYESRKSRMKQDSAKDERGKNGKADQTQDPQLRPLLAPVIRKDATDEQVAAAARKVEDYAAKNPQARKQIGNIARRIIAAKKLENYGTPKCQEFLAKWAKEFKDETGPPAAAVPKATRTTPAVKE